MNLVVFKLLSAAGFLAVGLVGGFLPAVVSKLSQFALHIAYAFAGGILAAVAVVHMLDDASQDLQAAGAKFAKALGGSDDAVFPLGNALFLIGFFCICSIEASLHHLLGSNTHYDHNGHGKEHVLPSGSAIAGVEELLPGGRHVAVATASADVEQPVAVSTRPPKGNAAGWATVIGLSIHSTVEGIAAGAVADEVQAGMVVLAIAAHKGFAAFANASVNLPMKRNGQRCLWIALVTWFALTGPGGMIIGLVVSADLDGSATAAVTALAAGTLLAVGVTEMLLPAFKDARGLGWKILAASVSMLAMSLLAVWA